MESMDRLYSIIQRLRGENGCPWDREQKTESLVPNIIEEAYEVVEAIESGNNRDLEEELGDLFFLVLFTAYVAQQEGRLRVEDAVNGISDKLIRRHPHVFGETNEKNVDRIIENWESIKRSEKKNEHRKTPFDGIPKGLPAIQRYNKVVDKAARSGLPVRRNKPRDVTTALKNFISRKSPAKMDIFLDEFLNYCYHNKLDLPRAIRRITDRKIGQFISASIKPNRDK